VRPDFRVGWGGWPSGEWSRYGQSTGARAWRKGAKLATISHREAGRGGSSRAAGGNRSRLCVRSCWKPCREREGGHRQRAAGKM
jgi:hypothetical protein